MAGDFFYRIAGSIKYKILSKRQQCESVPFPADPWLEEKKLVGMRMRLPKVDYPSTDGLKLSATYSEENSTLKK